MTYSNQAKKELLGVDEELLTKYGAVSEQVARAMAEGARRVSEGRCSLSDGDCGSDRGNSREAGWLVYMALSAG